MLIDDNANLNKELYKKIQKQVPEIISGVRPINSRISLKFDWEEFPKEPEIEEIEELDSFAITLKLQNTNQFYMNNIQGLEDNVVQLTKIHGDRFNLDYTPAANVFTTNLETLIENKLKEFKLLKKNHIECSVSADLEYAQTQRYTVDLKVVVTITFIQR